LSLEYTLDRLKLERESGQVEKLMQQYAHLTPFAENLTVLQKIKDMGLKTAILSNGSVDPMNKIVLSSNSFSRKVKMRSLLLDLLQFCDWHNGQDTRP
jgi:hypothetical protein